MLVLAPGAHSRVAVSARPEHWKGFQTSRPHHMDRKKLFIDYSSAKYDWPAICFPVVFCAAGCYNLKELCIWQRALTHTLTHTGKCADGSNGTNRLRPHPFWTKKRRKALYSKGWKALRRLVRMRSPVRIWSAAPK